jgi:hypothetical protein
MITAMTFLLIFLVIVAAMAAATIRALLHDGPGPQRPPVSHFVDTRFLGPTAR